MSERRISTQKLSKYLRVLEDDMIIFLYAAGLEISTNSQGHSGFKPEEVKAYISSLSEEKLSNLYELKRKWEIEHEIVEEPMEDYLSTEEVAETFRINAKKIPSFLNANNVRKIRKSHHVFWSMNDVLQIMNRPTKKQATDLHKLRNNSVSETHLHGNDLAELFGIPEQLVNRYKKVLRIENIYPLTKDKVLDIVADTHYEKRRDRFLTRNTQKDDDRLRIREEYEARPKEKLYSSAKAAELMGITPDKFRKVIKKLAIEPTDTFINRYKQEIPLYAYATILELTSREEFFTADTTSYDEQEQFEMVKKNIIQNVYDNVSVKPPHRSKNPYFANFYVGPTNSGKTYNALNALYEEYLAYPEGTYVYAAPLRMLAFEVYQKMVSRFGRENVGFITGEESINPFAPLLATTVEMTPDTGDALVLDEAHWIVEPARGHKWTKLLAGGDYKSLHILTASEAVETITQLVDDVYDININYFTRKTPIVFRGDINISQIPEKSVVVCFSRKAVYKTAQMLIQKSGKKVGVLYGALPLVAREQQINDFIDGNTDIIVATDVIGHGINLPVDNVIFAETEKFDGDEKRDLHLWEAAQIAGRAGRFGLSEQGNVYTIRFDWNDIDKSLVEAATLAAGGTIGTNLVVTKAQTAPRFGDLHIEEPDIIQLALEQWNIKLTDSEHNELFEGSVMREQKARLDILSKTLKTPLYPWDLTAPDKEAITSRNEFAEKSKPTNKWLCSARDLWSVVDGIFDPKLPTIQMVGRWLQADKDTNIITEFTKTYIDYNKMEETPLEELESLARITSELKMLSVIFPDTEGLLYVELEHFEELVGERIIEKILDVLNNQHGSECVGCGDECPVYYSFCSECYSKMPHNKKLKLAS